MAEAEKCPRCEGGSDLDENPSPALAALGIEPFWRVCRTCSLKWDPCVAFMMCDRRKAGRRAADQPAEWPEGVPEENGLYWRSFSGFVCLVRREDERWFYEYTGPDDFFFPIEDMKFWRIEKPEPHSSGEG